MAIDHKFSNTGATTILELLQANVKFIVPKFQRNYSWNREKVAELWYDIMDNFSIYKNNPDGMMEAQYLLGPVVLVRGEKQSEFLVIDGQQRLATLTMLFCVARDIIREHVASNENTKPEGIEKINELIENTHMQKHVGWKLELNDTDKELFREIQNYENDKITQRERIEKLKTNTKSEKLLRNNYIFLYDKIINSLRTGFDDAKSIDNIKENLDDEELKQLETENISMLNYFLSYVREYNFVVKIMVADDNTAFQIFETLNYRGQTLSKSNLIKNHILNQVDKANKDLQTELSNKWNKIFDEIMGDEQRDDEFIMESLRSRKPDEKNKISIKNLYKIIKTQINDEKTCKQHINNLKTDAEFLTQLNTPSSYSDYDTKDEIYALKALGAKFIRIPILTAYRKWGFSKDYQTLVRFLVKFFFKFRIVRQEHPGNVERVILNTTKMILEGNSLKKIIEEVKKDDDHKDFEYNFNKFMAEPKKDVAKYILQQITLYLGTENDDVRPIDRLTLEHILPQNYTNSWNTNDFLDNLGDDMEDYVSRLGNLTLLHSAINSSIANSSFRVKKMDGYIHSQLKINIETVNNQDDWTAKIIKEREIKFADYASNIWNLDSF